MSERVKLADAKVLSALASTDYLLAERNGAIGRAAMGDNTLLTEAQRLWLEYYPKASGANLLPNDISDPLFTVQWDLEESLLDGVDGASIDPSTITGEWLDIRRTMTGLIIPATWYTFTVWYKGGPWSFYVTDSAAVNDTAYENGSAVRIGTVNLTRTVAAADDWTKYTFTWKVVESFTSGILYIRKAQSQADVTYVCMPKFERGPVATPWAG